jgi:hypothetical protein
MYHYQVYTLEEACSNVARRIFMLSLSTTKYIHAALCDCALIINTFKNYVKTIRSLTLREVHQPYAIAYCRNLRSSKSEGFTK